MKHTFAMAQWGSIVTILNIGRIAAKVTVSIVPLVSIGHSPVTPPPYFCLPALARVWAMIILRVVG